jgi:O-methyltransferase
MPRSFERLKSRIRSSRYWPQCRRLLAYGIAVALPILLILMARLGLSFPSTRIWPSALFLFVVLNSWYGGLGPGVLSAVAVVVSEELLSDSTRLGDQGDISLLILLAMLAVVLSSVRAQRRQARASFERFPDRQDRTALGTFPGEAASTRILESLRDTAILALDSERRCRYANQAASRLLQRAPAELAGKTLFELFPDGDGSKVSSHLRRMLAGPAPAHFEEYLDSRGAWFSFHSYPNQDGLVFKFSDVSEDKRQEALRPLPVWNEDREFTRIFGKIEYTLVDHARCYILHQFAKQAAGLPGDLAEVGVYKGGTAKLLALTISPRAKKELHLFDTFTGMPAADAAADCHHEGDLGDTSLEAVQRSLRDCRNVHFYKGFFPATAGPIENLRFCMVHIDADIYKSVKDSCAFFYPRMEKGGIMVFDDYGFPSCPGARKAVDEFFADKPESPVYLPSGQCVVFRK